MKKGKSRNKRKKTRSRLLWIAIAVIGMAAITVAVCVAGMFKKEEVWKTGKCLEDTGRTSGGVHRSYSKTGV